MYPYKCLTDKIAALEAIGRSLVARTMSPDANCGYAKLSSRSFLGAEELAPQYAEISLGFRLKLGLAESRNSQSAFVAQALSRKMQLVGKAH